MSIADALRRGSVGPLCTAYDAALLDLDGVVYRGPDLIPHAGSALGAAREVGMRLAFVTNNAARTPAEVAAHLCDLGIDAGSDEVATSAQAAARLVAELVPAGSAVLVVGGPGLEVALRERGLIPVRAMAQDPQAVVQGYHPSVGWEQLAEGAYAVGSGLPWVASNLDLTIPTPRGIAPGNGALVQVIRSTTGAEPAVAGKPELALHRESAERVGASRPLVVGDRLDTDIEGAIRAGTDSLLVLTGVTAPADLLEAPEHQRPTYLAADLRGLLMAQQELLVADGAARLGDWWAAVEHGRLVLRGGGAVADGLRVACVARWSHPGEVDTASAARQLDAARRDAQTVR